MEIRNVKETVMPSVYDCEVDHEKFGWIPFTASPDDTEERGQIIYDQILKGKESGSIAVKQYDGPSLEEKIAQNFRKETEASEFQAKAALMQSGLLQDTLAYIDQADEMTKLAWETARVFKRSSHLISEVSESLGLTPEQMDDIFRFAMTIEV